MKNFSELIKKNIYILLFIILAIVATATIYYSVKAMSPSVPVVVASENLRVGQVIESSQIAVKYFPPGTVPTSAFSSTANVVGSTIINGPVVAGDMVRQEHLTLVGSLRSILYTYAPEGWHGVELPVGAGLGLKGLKKGDYIQIYGEVFSGEGSVVDIIVPEAIILSVPGADITVDNYIVAVPSNYAKVIAESLVRGKMLALAMPDLVPSHLVLDEPQILEETAEMVEEVGVE